MIDISKLLRDPRMTGTGCLLLQEGKPPSAVGGSESTPLGNTEVTAGEIDQLLNAIPAEKRDQLISRAVPSCRLQLPGGDQVQFSLRQDEKGRKMVLMRVNGSTTVVGTPPEPTWLAPAKPSVAAPSPAAVSVCKAPQAEVSAAAAAQNCASAEIDALFRTQLAMKASDLHLSAGVVPMLRKDGEMVPIEDYPAAFTPAQTERLLWEIMPEKNREEFRRRHDTDFAREVGEGTRMRCNIFQDRKGMGGVFRAIPRNIITAEQLGLSPEILKLCSLRKGLVLVVGPTGSGKSTTLCAMVDYMNRTRRDHIITIEDPLEFVHENKNCLINQREVRSHTDSFSDALRAALREDPDIVLIGEMRDLETVAIAIETAETGHLVLGTLHTNTAPSTVNRVVDQFPTDRQAQIRLMLAESIKGVIAQTLCRKIGGGRVAALETLFVDSGVANLIREGKTMQIPSAMQTGKAKGNRTLNDALFELVVKKVVEPAEAYSKAVDRAGFEQLLAREKIELKFEKAN